MNRISPENIKEIFPNQIFVFGSNEAGRHGKGAAKKAMQWGAIYGNPSGLQGKTYAIPTKDNKIKNSLSIKEIGNYVDVFIEFARITKKFDFLVTKIGCGLAGHKEEDIALLFKEAIDIKNILLPEIFWKKLGKL